MNDFNRIASIILISAIGLSLAVGLVSIVKQGGSRARNVSELKSLISRYKTVDKPGVAIIDVYGPIEITSGRSAFGGGGGTGSDGLVKRLDKLSENKNIKALVLRVNSPGGTIASVQEIYRKLQELRGNGMKVVVSMADIAASGGYYIACASDKILANPGTLTGSVGVIMFDLNLSGLMEKYGVRYTVIKSGSHKDIMSSFRSMTSSERNILQSIINNSFRQFRDVVVRDRRLNSGSAALISDGRVFTGEQAKKIGLVDELGGLEDAVSLAGKLAGLGESPAVYEDQPAPWDAFFEGLSSMFRGRGPNAASDPNGLNGMNGLAALNGMATGLLLRYQYMP